MININYEAPVQCAKNITIDAPIDSVWDVLTTIDRWKDWQTEISQSKINGQLKPSTTFKWKTGGVNIYSMIHTVAVNHQLGWTGKSLGLFAIHNWTLSEKNGKTLVEVEESMEGIVAQLFSRSLTKSLEKGMQTWLLLMKEECEQ